MLKCTLKKSGTLTEVCDPWTVVVGEQLVSRNRIGDQRSMDEVHLKQTSLQVTLLGRVLLQCIKKEGCRGLDHVLGQKILTSRLISTRARFVVDKL